MKDYTLVALLLLSILGNYYQYDKIQNMEAKEVAKYEKNLGNIEKGVNALNPTSLEREYNRMFPSYKSEGKLQENSPCSDTRDTGYTWF